MWLHRVTLILLTFCSMLAADPSDKHYSGVGVETIILDNGMKVALKHTDNEEDEVLIRLMAVGGFAELPISERAAGEISADAAVRSGISNYGFDSMHTMLYQHSIEFETLMEPFSRSIELSADSEELKQLFTVINLFFTKSRFSRKAFEAHKHNLIESFKNRDIDSYRQFEDAYMEFNTQQFHVFNTLKQKDIKEAKFEHSEKFFNRCFADPSSFVCVIVGDFDTIAVKKFVNEYLATIPKREDVSSPKIPRLPDFIKGVKTKVVKGANREDAVTRMTFPLQEPLTQSNVRYFENISCLIRNRLIKKICHHTDPRPEIRVSLEIPYYPTFHNPWVSIQYISDSKLVSSVGQSILVELKKIQFEGFTEEELEAVKLTTKSNDHLSRMENYYWITQIANYIIWDWDLNGIKKDYNDAPYWISEEVGKKIPSMFSFENYSIISLQP